MCSNKTYKDENKRQISKDLKTLESCKQDLEKYCVENKTLPDGWRSGQNCSQIGTNYTTQFDNAVKKLRDENGNQTENLNDIISLHDSWRNESKRCRNIKEYEEKLKKKNSECVAVSADCKNAALRAGEHIFNCKNKVVACPTSTSTNTTSTLTTTSTTTSRSTIETCSFNTTRRQNIKQKNLGI